MKRILIILAGFMISCGSQATDTESNTETAVETQQVQEQKKVIKKSLEKTEERIIITEYDEQGNITKIKNELFAVEFAFKNGRIISAKGGNKYYCEASINKQNNTASYCSEGAGFEVEFNEFGYKKEEFGHEEGNGSISYEYNKDGLLVKSIEVYEDYFDGVSSKITTTYTYDVMSQDWTKRVGTDDKGKKTVTTRTVEYW